MMTPRLRTYRVWVAMRYRCLNEKAQNFHRYGGRGIKVCDRWACFENFIADMGLQPPGLTLERLNNDGHYEPSNCAWVTRKENARNTSRGRFVEFRGERRCVSDWSELTGIHKTTILLRLNRGWPADLALTIPAKRMQAGLT